MNVQLEVQNGRKGMIRQKQVNLFALHLQRR